MQAMFPAETICHILRNSNPRDVVRWRAVSKWFRDITYDASIWRDMYAHSCLPRPPGPFPFQSATYLEQALIRTEKLAQSWTTRPMRITSRVEFRAKQVVCTGLLDGRWLVGCESDNRIVLYDVAVSTKTLAPQKQVIWELEEMTEVEDWDIAQITTEDGRFVLYLLLSGMHVQLRVPVWRFLGIHINRDSGKLCSATIFDIPESPMDLDVKLDGGKSPFLYIWYRNLVFDTRTQTFYEFPDFSIALEETWCKIDANHTFSDFPSIVVLTRTHVIVIHKLSSTVSLMQAFTVDGFSVRDNKAFLRLSHEGISYHRYQTVTLLRNSVVDPVTGSTDVRLFDVKLEDDRIHTVFHDLTLLAPAGSDISPIIVVTDEKASQIRCEDELECCIDCSDAGHLRGFFIRKRYIPGFLPPHRKPYNHLAIKKFVVDATQGECTVTFGDPPHLGWDHSQDPLCGTETILDGANGRLCYIQSWKEDEQVIVVADIEYHDIAMDVSNLLASHAAKIQSTTVEKDTPFDVDPGLLTITDPNPIDHESYAANLEEYLQSTARDGIQALFAALYVLPTHPSPDGPLAALPAPATPLPRAKPLPSPKPPTKWERFAASKGIQKKRRDRKIWDEEKQAWVDRWGRGGKNKEVEAQWVHEVKPDAAIDHDPAQAAKSARKARVAKNERQRLQNMARAQEALEARTQRRTDIERTLASTRVSTASMGKFDKKLEGDKKMRGVKRKFDPAEASVEQEKQSSLTLLSKLEGEAKRARKEKGGDDVLNVRKAIKVVSKGRGSVALGRETTQAPGPKGKRGKR